MAQAKTGWKNPISGQHVKGAFVGAALVVGLGFVWPGLFMLRSSAQEKIGQAASVTHAEYASYCVEAYLSAPGRTPEQVRQMKSASTSTQAAAMLKDGFARNEVQAAACGKAIDKLTDAQIAAVQKK